MGKLKTESEATDKTTPVSSAGQQKETPLKTGGGSRAAGTEREQEGAARSADLLTSPATKHGAVGRARASSTMQRAVGNARLNRMMSSGGEREREALPRAARASANTANRIQPLSVSRPDDASEKEAETVARSVVSGQKAPPIKSLAPGSVQMLARGETRREDEKQDDKPAHLSAVRRQTAEEERSPALAQRLERDETGQLNASAAADAIARKSAGSPLDPALRRRLEPRMGADLGEARIHQDSVANEAASAINARAFTHGPDIFLARGESERDTQLMAHELTHVVQQRGGAGGAVGQPPPISRKVSDGEAGKVKSPATVQPKATKGAGKPAGGGASAPGFLDLKGMSEFTPSKAIDEFLDEHEEAVVQMRYGSIAEGPVEVKKRGEGKYTVKREKMPLRHPVFVRITEAFPDLEPSLIVKVEGKKLEGFIGLATLKNIPSSHTELAARIADKPEMLGLVGFDFASAPKITNKLDAGQLHLGLTGVKVRIGSAFDATLSLEAIDTAVTFSASAQIKVKGLEPATLDMKREPSGAITGQVSAALQLTKEFSGAFTITWGAEGVSGQGKIGYQGEKMSGEITLVLMERGMAAQLEAAKKAPPEEAMAQAGGAPAAPPAAGKGKPKKLDYVVFGEGDLTFAFNDWLNGTAHVIVDPKGFVTIIGKITPQKEFPLFEPKEFIKPLFKVEARAAYGLPVVGNIFIFANFSMDAFAKLEGKLYNITAEGTYSTDPEKSTEFQISGSLNISAGAGLRLRGEAGAGVEILDHDLKAGAGINGILGIKGYADAQPVIGYREKGAPGEDKKGEFFIRGDVEIAVQPFLGLSGDLFVEVDAPWWSPLDDDKWTWPLFNKEWPLGGSFGMLASVDYVFGSGQWPTVEFKPVEFDADKFTTDLYNDRAKPKSGAPGEQKGTWKEKNEPQAEPPVAPEGKGDAKKGKPAELPPAKPKVTPGGKRSGRKEANPGDKTAEGKSVRQLQDEAKKKGRKPKGRDLKTGAETDGAPEKDPAKKEQSDELRKGLAALQQVTDHYAKTGATKEEVVAGVKSVRRKFKVFKSIEVIEREGRYDYEYVYNPPGGQAGPQKAGIPTRRYLPADYDVRAKLYERGSGWKTVRNNFFDEESTKVKDRIASILEDDAAGQTSRAQNRVRALIREEKLPEEAMDKFDRGTLKPNYVDKVDYHIDHISPLAEHWKEHGFESGDKSRWDKTISLSNLRLITKEANLSKGGKDEDDKSHHYADKPYVGKTFVSIYADDGAVGAKRIDKKYFRDEEKGGGSALK
ncbi:MAG TPA: DUF4157 domain-containing protein [Pyrinomonadaceae bacterium]|nr:DUF4157 domain-containing protein [Pyrinomonadaceae bacterium]